MMQQAAVTSEAATRSFEAADDKAVLHSMGYAQELLRGMRTFQNFAISFSIICILSGGINSFSQGGVWPAIGNLTYLFLLGLLLPAYRPRPTRPRRQSTLRAQSPRA